MLLLQSVAYAINNPSPSTVATYWPFYTLVGVSSMVAPVHLQYCNGSSCGAHAYSALVSHMCTLVTY